MSQLRVRARNDARTSQRSTTKHPAGITMSDMLSLVDPYTSGADQSFYANGQRIAIGASTLTGMADFVKGPRLGREKCEPQKFDLKPLKIHTSPSCAQQNDCVPSTHRKSVPTRRLASTRSSQSPSENILSGRGVKSVPTVKPSTTRNPSRLAIQTKGSTAPLCVSKADKADDNTLTSLVFNPIREIKNNKIPLLQQGDESDRYGFRKLESEAVEAMGLSYAEAVDFEHIEHFSLKDILRLNETRVVPLSMTSQRSQANSFLKAPINEELRGEANSKSSQKRPPLADNVNHKAGERHISKDSLDIQTMKIAPSVTPLYLIKQHLSPKGNQVTTLTPNGKSPMRDSPPPDVVSSITSKYEPNQPRVQESSSRKDTLHAKRNASDYLLDTSIRNMEKEGLVHPKKLHPQQAFRELDIPKELSDEPITDKRNNHWKRTKRNDKRRRVSTVSSHSSEEEDQEAHNAILCRQQKVVEDAVSKKQISSHGGANNRRSEPIPESVKRHHCKNKGSSLKSSGLQSVVREACKHPGFSFKGTAGAKRIPSKENTLKPTIHKTLHKGITTKDTRKIDVLPVSQEELKLHGSHLLTSRERQGSLHNGRASKGSGPPNSMVSDSSVKMSWSTGDKPMPTMTGSDFKKGNNESQHTKKPRGNAVKSKSGRIKETGSCMSNSHVSCPKARVQISPSVVSLTPVIYNPALTSPFSMIELPRDHKDNNATMKKKASVPKMKTKKNE